MKRLFTSAQPGPGAGVAARGFRPSAVLILLLAAGVLLWLLVRVIAGSAASADVPGHGMVCTTGPDFSLMAVPGYISTPEGNSVYMWSYALDEGPATKFQYPGPTLCVNEGDTVSITVENQLPAPERTSTVFPGQTDVLADGVPSQPEFNVGTLISLTKSAITNDTVTYSFVAERPGTFIYESGTNPHKQIQMGLVGTIVVRPTMGAGYAYNDASTAFNPDREVILLMHEIDPDLHQAVEQGMTYDVTKRHDRYWTLNGRSMPDTIAGNGVPWLPSQPYGSLVRVEPFDDVDNPLPVLVRVANAGTTIHPFHPHGNHMEVIGQDGDPTGTCCTYEQFGLAVAPGQTFDTLWTWEDVEGWDPEFNPKPQLIPGLQNLVFGEFTSGDNYLGQTGTFPTDHTSYNECGEYYFPWHSHALNEVQNFDEGFGGMITLARVDPPGGCP